MMAVWIWLRRWGWVPVGAVLLGLGFVFGKIIYGPRGKPVVPPNQSLKNAIDRNNQAIDAEIAQAKRDHDTRIQEINNAYEETINGLDEAQRRRKSHYERNPRELAKWLSSLSRDTESQ